MALTPQDIQMIVLEARDVAREALRAALQEHISACPHGHEAQRTASNRKAVIVGIGIGAVLFGGVSGAAFAAILKALTPAIAAIK